MTDSLAKMLSTQLQLQIDSFKNDPANLTDEQAIEWVRWNTLALTDELHEALAEVGWKPWATSKHFNRDAFVAELVDAFCFFMNLLLVANCTAEEFLALYLAKRDLNAKRQEAGYDGVAGKCSNCGRALDDPAVICSESACAHA